MILLNWQHCGVVLRRVALRPTLHEHLQMPTWNRRKFHQLLTLIPNAVLTTSQNLISPTSCLRTFHQLLTLTLSAVPKIFRNLVSLTEVSSDSCLHLTQIWQTLLKFWIPLFETVDGIWLPMICVRTRNHDRWSSVQRSTMLWMLVKTACQSLQAYPAANLRHRPNTSSISVTSCTSLLSSTCNFRCEGKSELPKMWPTICPSTVLGPDLQNIWGKILSLS